MKRDVVKAGDPTRALIKAIAMDIGKEVVHHIEMMYPKAIEATSSTFKLSVRNCVHNEIVAAIEVTDEGEIIARLRERKGQRRKIKALSKCKTMPELLRLLRKSAEDYAAMTPEEQEAMFNAQRKSWARQDLD